MSLPAGTVPLAVLGEVIDEYSLTARSGKFCRHFTCCYLIAPSVTALPLMHKLATPLLFVASLAGGSLVSAQTPIVPRSGTTPVEWTTEISWAAKSDISEGTQLLGEFGAFQSRASLIRTVEVASDSRWLFGAGWQRFWFSRPDGSAIPESLTALAAKIGYNRELSPQWSLRAEIDPGLYSDLEDLSAEDFNAPAGLRFIYAASRELQWFFALNLDLRSDNPVLGGPGLRWVFAPKWTLLLLIPAPRIEYAATSDLTLFAGANLRGGSFRVAEDFGRRHGRPQLDDQNVSYRELGAGIGARWKLSPTLTLSAGAGWVFDRRFEFDDRDLLLNGDGAVSFQLTLNGTF